MFSQLFVYIMFSQLFVYISAIGYFFGNKMLSAFINHLSINLSDLPFSRMILLESSQQFCQLFGDSSEVMNFHLHLTHFTWTNNNSQLSEATLHSTRLLDIRFRVGKSARGIHKRLFRQCTHTHTHTHKHTHTYTHTHTHKHSANVRVSMHKLHAYLCVFLCTAECNTQTHTHTHTLSYTLRHI